MSTFRVCKGRYGNAIFRYLGCIVFSIVNNIDNDVIKIPYNHKRYVVSDEFYINWMDNLLKGKQLKINTQNICFIFDGYYQHDKIYIKYRKEIFDWIKNHPNDTLSSCDNVIYKSIDLIHPIQNNEKKYNLCVHLRLEDFINLNQVIHPKCIDNILEQNINDEHFCFVMNFPKTELEKKYVEYFQNKYKIILENNTAVEDFHILKNCKILILSNSTLSWCAIFFSDSIEKVYMPKMKNIGRIHETFKKPIENTIMYDINQCSEKELWDILNAF